MIDLTRPRTDSTGGRSFADKDRPGRLTRISLKLARKMERRLETVKQFATENAGFDHIVPNDEERVAIFLNRSPEESSRMRALHGDEMMDAEAREVADLVGRGIIPREFQTGPAGLTAKEDLL